jgi:hypothetical protein
MPPIGKNVNFERITIITNIGRWLWRMRIFRGQGRSGGAGRGTAGAIKSSKYFGKSGDNGHNRCRVAHAPAPMKKR